MLAYTAVLALIGATAALVSPTPRQILDPDVLPDVGQGAVYYDPPRGQGRTLRAYGRPDLCITVQSGQAAGAPSVELGYCFDPSDSTTASWAALQAWNVTNPASGEIKIQGTEYCLDAGNNPLAGDYLNLWPCGHNPEGNNGQNWNFPSEDYLQGPNNLCVAIDPASHKIRAGPYDIMKLLWLQPCNAMGNDRDTNQIFANSGYPQ